MQDEKEFLAELHKMIETVDDKLPADLQFETSFKLAEARGRIRGRITRLEHCGV